ncbi:MAG: hypothetical protein WBH77_09050 [Saccharofermentanales bacterium]
MDQNSNYNPQQQYQPQQQQYQPQQQQYQPQQQQYQPQQQQYQQQYQQPYQQAPKLKGATMLKVVGILMIIGAGIGIIVSIISITTVGAMLSLAAAFGVAPSAGLVYASLALAIIGSIIQLIAGILGVKHNNNKAKAGNLVIWGGAVAGLNLVSAILSAIGGNGFPILSLLLGMVVPVLYIVGAMQNKNS